MAEITGLEALWLLQGAAQGRLAYVMREQAVVRPAVRVPHELPESGSAAGSGSCSCSTAGSPEEGSSCGTPSMIG